MVSTIHIPSDWGHESPSGIGSVWLCAWIAGGPSVWPRAAVSGCLSVNRAEEIVKDLVSCVSHSSFVRTWDGALCHRPNQLEEDPSAVGFEKTPQSFLLRNPAASPETYRAKEGANGQAPEVLGYSRDLLQSVFAVGPCTGETDDLYEQLLWQICETSCLAVEVLEVRHGRSALALVRLRPSTCPTITAAAHDGKW